MDSKILDLSKMDGIRSILVVRLKALGDIVLSLPVISALRRHFPRARICYLCWGVYAEALMGETGLDEVLELPRNFTGQISLIRKLRLQKIDLVIDLLSSPRSALITFLSGARLRVGMNVGRHNWCYHYVLPRIVSRDGKRVKCYTLESNRGMLRMLNLDAAGLGLRIGFPAAGIENDWADAYVEELGVDRTRLVGIVPGTTYGSKSWPLESFIELTGRMIRELVLKPIVLWGPGEEYLADRIVKRVPGAIKAPETGIAKLGALIGKLRLLVTLDSGPKHLAVIQGIPTVTLFGPTDPCIWDPMTENHRVICRDLPCSPCRKKNCEPNVCLTDITPRDVTDIIADILGTQPGRIDSVEGERKS